MNVIDEYLNEGYQIVFDSPKKENCTRTTILKKDNSFVYIDGNDKARVGFNNILDVFKDYVDKYDPLAKNMNPDLFNAVQNQVFGVEVKNFVEHKRKQIYGEISIVLLIITLLGFLSYYFFMVN